jgi:hypothetical protein
MRKSKLQFYSKIFLLGIILVSSCVVFDHLLDRSSSLTSIAHQIHRADLALKAPILSKESVWDHEYLEENQIIKTKLQAFENGKICQSLRTLDTKEKSHQEIAEILSHEGYTYQKLPFLVDPLETHKPSYYLKNGSITQNIHHPDIVSQEIFSNSEGCVVRIKIEGFPHGIRSKPHSIKAVLIDPEKGATYENEAFKITWDGKAVPKGPLHVYGLKSGLSLEDHKRRTQSEYVNYIMQEAHPVLKYK